MKSFFSTHTRMISNYLAFAFSILEIFLYAGAVYGYGFVQYILEKESIFWDELCFDETKHVNCTLSTNG